MADSLLDKVKAGRAGLVKTSNGLAQTSQEEIDNLTGPKPVQQLAGQAGLASPPTDPASTAAIGGTPDQQKMAGTPAQVNAAVRISNDRNASLSDQERRNQSDRSLTSQEQAGQQKSKDLQDLGQLGDRVNSFIVGQRSKLAAATVPATNLAVAPGANISGLPSDPTALSSLKDAAKALLSNPSDANAMLAVNQALGRDVNTTVSPAEISQLYQSSADAIAKSGADSVVNSLTVDGLVAAGTFPYTQQQLATLLNVPADQIGHMDVNQFKQQLDLVASQEYAATSHLDQQATNNLAGGAEQQFAHQQAKENSRVGLRSTEQDMANLDQQISNADQVSFGGKTYAVGDLLKDDTISGIISDYVNSADGSPERTNLEQTEPELVNFINNNKAVLDDAVKSIGQGAEAFSATQDFNKQVGKVAGVNVNDDVLKALFPNYGELSASKIDPNQTAFYQRLNQLDDKGKANFVNSVNALSDPKTKDLIPQLAGLSKEELAKLELERGPGKSPKITDLIANRSKADQLANISPSDTNAIISQYTGGIYKDPASLQQQVTANRAANILGIGGNNNDLSIFDSDHDGKIDPGPTLLASMLKQTPTATLKDAANGSVHTFTGNQIKPYAPANATEQLVYNKLAGAAADGKLTPEEISKAGFTEDEMYQLGNLPNKWGPAGKTITDALNKYRVNRTSDILASHNFIEPKVDPSATEDYNGKAIMSANNIRQYQDSVDHARSVLDDLNAIKQQYQQSGKLNRIDNNAVDGKIAELNKYISDTSGGINRMTSARQQQIERINQQASAAAAAKAKDAAEAKKRGSITGKLAYGAQQAGEVGKTVLGVPAGGLQAVGKGVGAVADKVQAVGCFIAGTLFTLYDGSLKPIEQVTPLDRLLNGGETYATATFIGTNMHDYCGIMVAGSHAVMEEGKWVRVRDSAYAIPREELDGCLVYVVWNQEHRMVHESGIIFADYAETDSTEQEIYERRNLTELDAQTLS